MTLPPRMCIARWGGPDYSLELGRGVSFTWNELEVTAVLADTRHSKIIVLTQTPALQQTRCITDVSH